MTYLYWCIIFEQRLKHCKTYYTITTYTGKDVLIASNVLRFCVLIKFCLHYISSQQYTKVKVVQSNVQVLQFRDCISIFAIWNWFKKTAASIPACIKKFFSFGALRIQFYMLACLTVKMAFYSWVYLLQILATLPSPDTLLNTYIYIVNIMNYRSCTLERLHIEILINTP